MKYSDDRGGSKFLFIAILIIVFYLAFFNFNIPAAYQFTVKNAGTGLQSLGL